MSKDLTLFDKFFASANANLFYKEFSFVKNKFSSLNSEELELADCVIWLDDTLIVYQLKEREIKNANPTEEGEKKWFKKK